MQRYFVPESQLQPDRAVLTGEDAHHLLRVMRAEAGDRIIICNGKNRTVEAVVTALGKTEAEAEVVRELPLDGEPSVVVWVAQGLPKGDKLETVIQKGTELGSSLFIPFESERTVVQYDAKKEAKRLERWQKIAKEAAEQSHRDRVPEVEAPVSFKTLLNRIREADLALICYEKESGKTLREVLSARWKTAKPEAVLVIVGPEGGFSEREVVEAEAAGAVSVGLGRRILRTETAAMAALACILYENGEMGGEA